MDGYSFQSKPSRWEMQPLHRCCAMISETCDPSDAHGKPYLGLEHLASGFPALVGIGDPATVRSSKTMFRDGDVLYGKLRPYLRKAVTAPFEGICSTDILVFRGNNSILPKFLTYLVHSDQFVNQAKATTSGVNHPRTSWSKLKSFIIPLPPSPNNTASQQFCRWYNGPLSSRSG
jgi:type I restriction enzyme S subunit